MPWALLGFCIVMIYQVIVGLIFFAINGSPQRVKYRTFNGNRKTNACIHYFNFYCRTNIGRICLQKVFFGEIYNAIKGPRVVSFLIASIVSSLIFALAHNDFKFIPMYFGMGMIFSIAYVYTKRIAVPIGIHMLQNGTVVLMQVFGGDALKKAQEQANFILHFIIK